MADVNRWHRQIERRVLEGIATEVAVLKATTRSHCANEQGQRRMATRIAQLIAAKIVVLNDADKADFETRYVTDDYPVGFGGSWSEDDIDEGLKA